MTRKPMAHRAEDDWRLTVRDVIWAVCVAFLIIGAMWGVLLLGAAVWPVTG